MALENVRVEDFIEYFLFPEINGNLQDNETETLNDIQQKIDEISKSFIKNYIWHKDPFSLKIRNQNSCLLNNNNEQLPPHLYGISHFGDNIQDEWFIVALLFHISKELPSVIIRVCDADGEFVLIEAADHLPNWANPETCEQKVFIHNGHLLLIHDTSDKATDILPIYDSIRKIRENPTKYIVSKDIENCIMKRIEEFPQAIDDNLHRQTVFVPLAVAALLQHNPQLIAPAVQAFCNRDPIDMKACRAMRYFPPENRVYTSVLFTKCLYAMIMHTNYLPDRRTGWNIPLMTSPHYKAHLLGVKIACGFEILTSQAKSSKSDLETDREWQKYVDSLKNKNYFQNEIEGSKKYQELLEQAKDYYKENRDSMKSTYQIGDEILRDMKQIDMNLDQFKDLEKSLPDSDSDNWLNISPDELDDMLTKRYGIRNLLDKNLNENDGQLTDMLDNFLGQKSEYDGIDISFSSCNRDDDETKKTSDVAAVNVVAGNSKSTKIDFDADAFCSTVQNLLDLVIPEDNWESQSDMSDYDNEDDLLAKNIDDISKNRLLKGRKKKQQQQQKQQSNEKKSTSIDDYMKQMDRELAQTTIGKSFEKKSNEKSYDDGFDDIEDFQPVDVDMNAVKNMMESYKLQGASAGPTTNLLTSIMGSSKKQTDV